MANNVYKSALLDAWIEDALEYGAYPIKITIEIDEKGKVDLDQEIDGRKRRNDFLFWMRTQFTATTKIVPPPSNKRNVKEINKLWNTPLETMLRQVVYVGGVEYDALDPKEKYNTLNARAFRMALKDSYEAHTEAGLTISSPASLEKVAISTIASGRHYARAASIQSGQ